MDYRKSPFGVFFILFLTLSFSFIKTFDGIPKESSYCATWSSSQYLTETNNLPPISLKDNSIRQIVHVSIGGSTIRLKFSNRVGESKLELRKVVLANSVSQGSGEIDPLTLTTLTFNGKESVSIKANSEIYSDPFYYPLKVQSEVAISIFFGMVPTNLTSHAGSRTFSFIEEGNKITEKKFSDKYKTAHWYVITGIEVASYPPRKSVICYGDSITDGRGSTDDKQNRWTDVLSSKLYLNDKTQNVAVVNAGIGATFVRVEGQERFERDVLEIKGATYIIVLYGVNDILFHDANAEDIIKAYKTLITKAHLSNKFIFGATILPFGKNSFWTEERDKVRNEVNEWIRNSGENKEGFDDFFDFDEFTRDPNDIKSLAKECDSGDGLHPSPEGYKKIVESISNLRLFTLEPSFDERDDDSLEIVDKVGVKFRMIFNLNKDEEMTVRIRGQSTGSYGFRILTTNKEGKKNSDYYFTGEIKAGTFQINAKLKANEVSDYIEILRPISTINLDKITLYSIDIEADAGKQSFSPKNDGIFL